MRHFVWALALSATLSIGVAHAAPGFGASSHRLGGDSSAEKATAQKPERSAIDLLNSLAALAGFDRTMTVEPVAGERTNRGAGNRKECSDAKTTEVAKAEPKGGGESSPSKTRAPSGEPIYLAF